jgi:hypothetical protein
VTVTRLRGPYSAVQLHQLYGRGYDHTRWKDHVLRVDHTVTLGSQLVRGQGLHLLGDLSCGDGAVPLGIQQACPEVDWHPRSPILGDYAPHPRLDYVGPIDRTITRLPLTVDLFVLTETLEHLDDPAGVLTAIRGHARWLLLSTPTTDGRDDNPEHYWSWDVDGVRSLLDGAGWQPVVQSTLDLRWIPGSYEFQFWGCR